ncbi:SEC10/PgrA surface exclusion domain-containing protein [Limosilactobacillus sp. WF-MT5-A]|uniref:SEC10/PgrA surface exclusion domain-containing protein n=1 Tax=Limosilactobacillus agrestis TaxID=2759748 RepID=UPI0015F7DA6A|nr:SEC10/PgrA surface exclusion domain-containing protein [Limosilactobacillus agrestis]MBB1098532.1 SEC10/PgrA surface exclusion domain-containing protein [Limosilactobacillus agrestis]MCD7125974.1 SEC10/PgrA surface exclusion domain-containing protein [Limosilactobacillus agrestis]
MMKEHINFNTVAKEHKKLYKSGKTWMAATLMTVGLAGGAMLSGTTANADEVTPVQSAGTIQASQQATDPELANAQSDAQKQQSTIDSANAQLKDQQNQLSEAQGQQSSAQQELDQAKQAQQAATKNDPAVKQAQADVNQAQQQVDNQQQVVNDAQTALNNDGQNIQSATSAVSQASQAVDQARQTATDAINQAAAQQANEAQNKIDQLENQGKAQASQNLDNQINNVSGQVTDAQNNVNNTNSKISDLQDQVKDLQDQENQGNTDPNLVHLNGQTVDTSKSLLENAARNNLWKKTTYVSDGDWDGKFVPENIFVTPDEDADSFATANDGYSKTQLLQEWKLYETIARKTDIVNKQSGMTDAQMEELAILLMNQINHARQQRGLKPFIMTEQKYQQAQVRAKLSASRWSHNEDDILTAFGRDQYENLGSFDTNPANIQWGWNSREALDKGENPTDAYVNTDDNDPLTMFAILMDADEPVNDMLNNEGAHGGHRENFLEDTGDLNYDAAFGFAPYMDNGELRYYLTFDYDGPARNNTPNMMDRIAQYQAMGPITGDAKAVDNSAKINDLNNQITNLQNTLASQTSKLQSLQSQLQNLQAQKANVQFNLNQLSSDQQAEYNNAKETLATVNDWKQGQLSNLDSNSNVQDALNKLGSAKSNLESAKSIKAEDETNLQQAKDGLTSLTQILATKQSALDNAEQTANASANQAVKEAQKKLDTINGKIADLQNAIATTKATISNAQVQLDKDNQKITGIKNGQKPAKPDTDKDESNKGTTTPSESSKGDDQKDHQTTPVEPSKPSDGNKGNVTPSDPNKDSETTNPTTPSNPTTPAQPDTGNASISGQAGHKPATSDKSSEVSNNTATKPTIVLPTTDKENDSAVSGAQGQNTTMTREQYKAQQAKLPQTGNNDSKAVIALGVLAGMFGFGLVTKGKKEF